MRMRRRSMMKVDGKYRLKRSEKKLGSDCMELYPGMKVPLACLFHRISIRRE